MQNVNFLNYIIARKYISYVSILFVFCESHSCMNCNGVKSLAFLFMFVPVTLYPCLGTFYDVFDK
jgi:hypothetical protein